MDGQAEFAKRYAESADLELVELAEAYAELVEPAQVALRAEFKKRGLAWPEVKVVQVTRDLAEARFGKMSNHKLLDVARGYESLGDVEREALRTEFNQRGLEPPVIEEDDDDAARSQTNGEADAGDYVTVRAYRDLPEAIVARSVLEQAEIPCVLRDENTVRMDWGYSNAIGGVRLQVPQRFVADAEAVLAQPVPEKIAADTGEFVQPVCPRCGSLNVMSDDLDRKIKLASTTLSGLPLAIGLPALAFVKKNAWKCLKCDARWVDDEGSTSGG